VGANQEEQKKGPLIMKARVTQRTRERKINRREVGRAGT